VTERPIARLRDRLLPWVDDGIDPRLYRGARSDLPEQPSLIWRLRQPIVPVAKAALRVAGTVTAGQRVLPDYLIIGGKRTGSTTLARNLHRCDDVLSLFPAREDIKGTYFFDVHFGRGPDWYRSHFPTGREVTKRRADVDRPVVVGEASPYYLQHPHAAERAAALVPAAKIVCVVRDPIERAYSHYRERVRQRIETLDSFEAALDAEPERLAGAVERMVAEPDHVSLAHLNFGYVAQSIYAPAIARWLDAFGSKQVLLLRSEELFDRPGPVLHRVRRFLGLDEVAIDQPVHYTAFPGAPLSAELRARLDDYFAEDRRQVDDLLAAR